MSRFFMVQCVHVDNNSTNTCRSNKYV